MKLSLLAATQHQAFRDSESDESNASEQARMQDFVEAKRSDLRNGLTRRQRTFILEKLVGLNDKDAALSAGYSLSVAENTKQRIWKPRVRAEWERLRCEVASRTSLGPDRQEQNILRGAASGTTISAESSSLIPEHANIELDLLRVVAAGKANPNCSPRHRSATQTPVSY